MKLNKKKVLLSALAICILSVASARTVAWFSDSDSVSNHFYVANSDDDSGDEVFSVDVWEKTPDEDKDQDGYTFEDILPGDLLTKEVVVENTGYYDQYVRVTVLVSDAQAWMSALGTNGLAPKLEQIVTGWDRNANVWVDNGVEIVDDTIVYTMYYNHILLGKMDTVYDGVGSHSNAVTVFTAVKIPSTLTLSQATAFEDGFSVKVKAEAVQTENLGIDRQKGEGAKEAFAVAEGN